MLELKDYLYKVETEETSFNALRFSWIISPYGTLISSQSIHGWSDYLIVPQGPSLMFNALMNKQHSPRLRSFNSYRFHVDFYMHQQTCFVFFLAFKQLHDLSRTAHKAPALVTACRNHHLQPVLIPQDSD